MRTVRAALWLMRDVAIPALRAHRARALLTLAGVTTGAAVIVAIAVINRSVLTSFRTTAVAMAGAADLQIANGSVGVPEELAPTIAGDRDVAWASGLLKGTVETDAGELTVFGLDLLAEHDVHEAQVPRRHVHIPDDLAFAAQLDSIAVSTSFAERARLTLGSTLAVRGPTGVTTLTVRGFVDPVGAASLFGGAVALADLPAAQRLFARPGRVDEIDVELRPGSTPTAVAERLRTIVAGAGTVRTPAENGASTALMIGSVQTILTLASLNAVIAGTFLIYHTLQTAIVHRRRALALARTVGFTRKTVFVAVTIEALAFGVLGTVLGAVLGAAAASLSMDVVTGVVSAMYARTSSAGVTLEARDVAIVLALAIGSALAAVVLPARDAAQAAIVAHLRSDAEAPHVRPARTVVPWVAAIVVGLGMLLLDVRTLAAGTRTALIMAGVIVLTAGYVGLLPLGVALAQRPLARITRPLGVPARLALAGLARHPQRARSTIGAIMVAFALVIVIGSFIGSLRGTILAWIDHSVAADLWVSATPALPFPSAPALARTMEAELRAIPGVADVDAARMVHTLTPFGSALLKTRGTPGRLQFPILEDAGDEAGAGADEELSVSDNFAYRHRVRAGDTFALDTPTGRRTFRVRTVVADYGSDLGALIVDRAVYDRVWRDDLVTTYGIWLAPGTDASAVRRAIRARLGTERPVTIMTAHEFRTTTAGMIDHALLLTYAMALVAVVVAMIGVANFLLAEIVHRRRELGIVRGVLLSRRETASMLVIEAAVLGHLGALAAIAYAWPVALLIVTRSARVVSGWRLDFDFSTGLALVTAAIAAATAAAAAIPAARRVNARRPTELLGLP